MALKWKDRIKVASATTGTGTLTLGAAASGYQTFAAGDDGLLFTYVIEDGTAWETGYGTYTHAGTTFARTTRTDSSTGSAISCSGAEYLFVDLIAERQTANELSHLTYIAGLIVTRNAGGNSLDITAGSCYDPSSNKIITYAGTTALSAGTLGNSQWNQVYIYDNAGTVTIEVVNNANPPSTTYAGTARQGGTNSNRRWIGSFLTDAVGAIYRQDVRESGSNQFNVEWLATTSSAPFRCLSAGTSTTYAAVSLAGAAPRYAVVNVSSVTQLTLVTTATANMNMTLSIDGTNDYQRIGGYVVITGTFIGCFALGVLVEAGTPQIYYKLTTSGVGAGPNGYIDVSAYTAVR